MKLFEQLASITNPREDKKLLNHILAFLVEKIEIDCSFQDTLKDEKALNIILFLSALLPSYLNINFGTNYNKELFKTILNEAIYNELLENFIGTLKELKVPGLAKIQTALKYNVSKLETDKDTYDKLKKFLYENKIKLKKLSVPLLRDINRIIKIYNVSEFTDKEVKVLQELTRYLPNTHLKRYIKTIDGLGSSSTLSSLAVTSGEYNNALKKYFGTLTPTSDQIKNLKDTNLDQYRDYQKLSTELKKKAKLALEDVWDDRGFDKVEDVNKVKELLSELQIKDPIDKGFEGKVALSPSPSILFTYYTKYGKELENIPGSNVRMNPNYTEDDDTFYCIGYPQQNFTDNEYRFYTKDYRRRSLRRKHDKAEELANKLDIEALRSQYRKDFEPIISDHDLSNKAIAALVTAIIDDTAGRIGNTSESEKNGVYGIHNLLGKHLIIKKDGSSAILAYNGKKNVAQKHVITNPLIVEALKYLKSIRKSNQHLFSRTGEKPVSSSYINGYMKDLGFPDTAHGFRKFHANRIFNEVIDKNKDKIKRKPIEVFDKAVGEVAKKLGHQPINSIKSYINSDLIKDYFQNKAQVQPPKSVQKVLDLMDSGQIADSDDDD